MAKYFSQKSKWRIQDRIAQPKPFGPPSPYPFQRELPKREPMGPAPKRKPIIDYNPRTHDWKIMPTDRRKSLVPKIPYNPRQVNPVRNPYFNPRQFRQLRNLSRINPVLRMVDTGFQLLETEWAITHEMEGRWEAEPGYLDFYECPNPLLEGGFITRGSVLTTSIKKIPDYLKCLQSQSANPGPADGNLIFQGRLTTPGGNPRQDYKRIWMYPRNFTDPRPEWPDPQYVPGQKVTQRLPLSVPAPSIGDSQYTWPEDKTPSKLKPYERPSEQIEIWPDTNPSGPPRGPYNKPHKVLPPEPYEREKKSDPISRNTAQKVIASIYDKTTEAQEVVDILVDNLDGNPCKGLKSMAGKMNCIYNNLDKLDIDQVILDLIANHVEDKVFGRFYALGKKAPYGSQLPGSKPIRDLGGPLRYR